MRKRIIIVIWLGAVAMMFGLFPTDEAQADPAGRIYWTEDGEILRADQDGSDIEVLVSGLGMVLDLELDTNGGKMYWADFTNYKIQRADLDGSDTEVLVTDANATAGIALDVDANKMYWTNHQAAKIRRANLDGTNVEDAISLEDCLIPTGCPGAIAVDPSGGKLYWTRVSQPIQRANLDGSDVEDLVGVTVFSTGLAVDSAGGKLYWTVSIPPGPGYWSQSGGLRRSTLDGADAETLLYEDGSDPGDIALDVAGGKMYWADAGLNRIRRANLDGSGVEDVITRPSVSYGIALGPGAAEPVGGIAELPGIVATPLESPGASGMHTTGLLWTMAAITAGATAVAGAAWYARSRLSK
jgi:low density lipoprotein receptor-related protein 5/6